MASVNQVILELIARDQTAAALRSAAAGLRDFVSGAGRAKLATEDMNKEQRAAYSTYARLRSVIDDTWRSEARFAKGEETLKAAFKAKVISAREYVNQLDNLKSRYQGAAAGQGLFQRGAQGLGAELNRLKSIAITAGASLLTYFSFREILKQTSAQAEASAQLAAAIASTGAAAGRSQAQLEGWAAAAQKRTTFADEDIMQGQARLARFRNVKGANFDRASQLALDYGAATKTELPAAFTAIGKMIDDPVAGIGKLRKAGINLTQTEIDLVKSLKAAGDSAGAQAVLMGILEKSYGGTAEKLRNTMPGALAALKNSFGDLFELGGNITEPFRRGIEGVISALEDPRVKTAVNSVFEVAARGFEEAIRLGAEAAAGIGDVWKRFSGEFSAGLARVKLPKFDLAGVAAEFATLKGPAMEFFGALGRFAAQAAPVVIGLVKEGLIPLAKLTFAAAVTGLDLLGKGLSFIADHGKLTAIALAGIGTGLLVFTSGSAFKAVMKFATTALPAVQAGIHGITAAMAANPLGLLIVGVVAAGTAIYAFRHEISELITGQRDFGAAATAVWQTICDHIGVAVKLLRDFADAVTHPLDLSKWATAIGSVAEAATTLRHPGATFDRHLRENVAASAAKAFGAHDLGGWAAWNGSVEKTTRGFGVLRQEIDATAQAKTTLDDAMDSGANETQEQLKAYASGLKAVENQTRTALAMTQAYRTGGTVAAKEVAKQEEIKSKAYGATGAKLDLLKQKTEALNAAIADESFARLTAEIADQERSASDLGKALAGGVQAYDNWTTAARMASEAGRTDVETFLDLARRSNEAAEGIDRLSASAAALRPLNAKWQDSFISGIGDALSKFHSDFIEKGFSAAKSFGSNLRDVLKQSLNAIFWQGLVAPLVSGLSAAVLGAVNGLSGPGGGLASIFNFGGYGSSAGGAAGSAGGLLGSLGNIFSGGLSNLGSILTKGLGALQSPFLGNIGASIGQFFGGSGAFLGNVGLNAPLALLGNAGGDLLSSILGIKHNATNANIGGTIGGIAGNLIPIPVLGPIIGAALGNVIGGLFGPQATNAGVGQGFNPATGEIYNVFNSNKGESAKNLAGLQEAEAALIQQTMALAQMGVTFTEAVNAVNIGARDATQFWLNPLGTVTANNTGAREVKLSSVGDTKDLATQIMKELLHSATSQDASVRDALSIATNTDELTKLITAFKAVDALSGDAANQTFRYVDGIKAATDQIDSLRSSLSGLGSQAAASRLDVLDEVRAKAISKGVDQFIADNRTRGLTAINPAAAQWEALQAAHKQAENEAKKLAELYGRTDAVIAAATANAAEDAAFKKNLSDEQRAALGLANEAATTSADRLRLAAEGFIANQESVAATLRSSASAATEAASRFRGLETDARQIGLDARDKYRPIPLRQSADEMRTRLQGLLGTVQSPDATAESRQSASTALHNLAPQYLELQFQRLGPSPAFYAAYDEVQAVLSQDATTNAAQASAQDLLALTATRQADLTAEAVKELQALSPSTAHLAEIRDLLSDAGPLAGLLSDYLAASSAITGLPTPDAGTITYSAPTPVTEPYVPPVYAPDVNVNVLSQPQSSAVQGVDISSDSSTQQIAEAIAKLSQTVEQLRQTLLFKQKTGGK